MTMIRRLEDRLKLGTSALLGALLVGTMARLSGMSPAPVYWAMFILSSLGTLYLLGIPSHASAIRADWEEAEHYVRRVLLFEYKVAFPQAFATTFTSHGAEIDTLNLSEYAKPGGIRRKYDLIIADADLPYGTLAEFRSTAEEQRQVLVVIKISPDSPVSSPRSHSFEIFQTFGPPDLRSRIERVLSAAPA